MKSWSKDWVKTVTVIAIVTLFLLLAFWGTYSLSREIRNVKSVEYEVADVCNMFSLEKELVLSIICVESGFDQNAVSQKGAVGLMQILPETAQYIDENVSESDLFIPEINILLGAKYFRYLLNKFESENLAIIAYNAGEGNVSKWLKDSVLDRDKFENKRIPFKETRKYIEKVQKKMKFYKKLTSII